MLSLVLFCLGVICFKTTLTFHDDIPNGKRVYLTAENFERAKKIKLDSLPADFIANFELHPINKTTVRQRRKRRRRRSVAAATSLKWPGAIVPYQISGDYTSDQLDIIAKAISQFHDNTCVKWIPYTDQADYVTIFSPKKWSCWSTFGRQGGEQKLALGFVRGSTDIKDTCIAPGHIVHEMMHTLGFYHEHNRPDRDEFVEIKWKNMDEEMRHQFDIEKDASTLGLPYDYASVMHYANYALSKKNADGTYMPTIIPLKNSSVELGNKQALSALDIAKINAFYCRGNEVILAKSNNVRCWDKNAKCRMWAKNKKCKKRSGMARFMKKNCRLSCRIC